MGVEIYKNLLKSEVFLKVFKKKYEKVRFFLNISIYMCDTTNRKPAKPLSSDTLNLVGVSFWGQL